MPSSGFKTSALRSEEHTSELQSHDNLGCRLLLEKNQAAIELVDGGVREQGNQRSPSAILASGGRASKSESRSNRTRLCFFFNDAAPTEIYPLALPDALRY